MEVLQCDWGTSDLPSDGHLQRKARENRYQLLSDACRGLEISDLLVAHHLDDQIETFLMRLMASSGLEGLPGMRSRETLCALTPHEKPINVLRPLLDVEKTRLEATCEALQQNFVSDPSNADPKFMRVRARAIVSALRRGEQKASVVALLSDLASAREEIAAATTALIEQSAEWHAPPYCFTLELRAVAEAPGWVQQRVLTRLIQELPDSKSDPGPDLNPDWNLIECQELQGPAYPPKLKKIQRLQKAITEWHYEDRSWCASGKSVSDISPELKGSAEASVCRGWRVSLLGGGLWLELGADIADTLLTTTTEQSAVAVRARRHREWSKGDTEGLCSGVLAEMPVAVQRLCCSALPVVVHRASDEILHKNCTAAIKEGVR